VSRDVGLVPPMVGGGHLFLRRHTYIPYRRSTLPFLITLPFDRYGERPTNCASNTSPNAGCGVSHVVRSPKNPWKNWIKFPSSWVIRNCQNRVMTWGASGFDI